jgi:hypothetical protein
LQITHLGRHLCQRAHKTPYHQMNKHANTAWKTITPQRGCKKANTNETKQKKHTRDKLHDASLLGLRLSHTPYRRQRHTTYVFAHNAPSSGRNSSLTKIKPSHPEKAHKSKHRKQNCEGRDAATLVAVFTARVNQHAERNNSNGATQKKTPPKRLLST